ncbi:MAG TPA: hypothetical protein DIT97_16075 [Gimesia maris]|uniref:DUF5131 domain-containing protein n=1 Tax=Gimesia maris TaxID=122 RepID=A0A3D3RA23_9PLAN|nr:hypothetical protein [Gimesia maris]
MEHRLNTFRGAACCMPITAGCKNCYAMRFAERWRGVPGQARLLLTV